MVGDNDFCSDMCYTNPPEKVLKTHEQELVTVLRLIRDSLPRTFFNLIITPCKCYKYACNHIIFE